MNKKIAILIAAKFHEEETTIPRDYFSSKNVKVDLLGLESGPVMGKNNKFSLIPDKCVGDVDVKDYDGLLIPGGGAPELIRINDAALEFVRAFWATGRPVGTICHGPQVLISAGVLDKVTLTCYAGIRDDVKNAGGIYVDKPVCVDGQLISSRQPGDLPEFNKMFDKALFSGFVPAEESDLKPLAALELAINREKGAQEFYENAALVMKTEALANKFRYLATIEAGHFEQLSELYTKLSGGKLPAIDLRLSEISKKQVSDTLTSDEAIDLSIQAEQKAFDFYRHAALKAVNPQVKEMFEYLASEELEHKRILLLDKAANQGGQGHFQWATHFDIPPGMDDLW